MPFASLENIVQLIVTQYVYLRSLLSVPDTSLASSYPRPMRSLITWGGTRIRSLYRGYRSRLVIRQTGRKVMLVERCIILSCGPGMCLGCCIQVLV